MRISRRGLSLVEVMICMLLVGIVLAVTARLFTGYSTALRHSNDKNRELEVLRSTLERLGSELSQATEVIQGADSVEFQRITPGAAIPSPLEPGWSPRSRLTKVRYSLEGTDLIRSVSSNRLVAATGINGFFVEVKEYGYLVRISVLEEKLVRTLSTRAYRWTHL